MQPISEIRLAVRSLLRARMFTAIAVTTLGLGIGAAVATFSVYDAILLNPLPYEDPGRLVMLWIDDPAHGVKEEGFGYPTYVDWRERNHVFEDVAACIRDSHLEVRTGETFDRELVNFTPANLFSVLGVTPAFGRAFTQEEDRQGAAVAVVSAAFAERFGGAAHALGKTFEIEGGAYEIVGVAPDHFGFPHPETVAWIPWPAAAPWGRFRSVREMDALRGVARLELGVTPEEAERDLDAIGLELAEEHPPSPTFAGFDVNVVPLLEQVTGADLPRLMDLMLAGIALLFVIACVNLVNLILVRNEARAMELSVRRTLGASGWALLRGRAVEACVVAAVGLAAGVGLAQALLVWIVNLAPAGIPRIESAGLNAQALGVAGALALAAVLAASLAPAKAGRLAAGARGVTASGESRRLQSAFVMGQAAIALVLLSGAALFVRSFQAVLALDPGYRTEDILLATVEYRQGKPDEIHREFLRRLRAYPGVESAGGTSAFQIALNPDIPVHVPGREENEDIPVTGDFVTPGYFESLGAPLLRGRLPAVDDLGKDVALINETLARQVWPTEDPIGAVLEVGGGRRRNQIIGVIGDMRRQGLEREPIAQIFRPVYTTVMTVAIHTRGDREALANWIRDEFARLSPASVPVKLTTIEQTLAGDMAPRRFYTALVAGFAGLALGLSAVGLFGLMAYVVERRTREIGLRVAVGARPADVLGMVLKQGVRLVVAGCAAGLVAMWWMAGLFDNLLFGTTGRDGVSLLCATAALIATGALACFLPARRAAAIDPATALRQD